MLHIYINYFETINICIYRAESLTLIFITVIIYTCFQFIHYIRSPILGTFSYDQNQMAVTRDLPFILFFSSVFLLIFANRPFHTDETSFQFQATGISRRILHYLSAGFFFRGLVCFRSFIFY